MSMVWCKVQDDSRFPDQSGEHLMVAMDLFLDPDQKRGATKALFVQLREGIMSGRFGAGERRPRPPSGERASQLGMSRHTVPTVYGRLVAEGFAEGHAGGGTIVGRVARTQR